jgi:hypothetical protein
MPSEASLSTITAAMVVFSARSAVFLCSKNGERDIHQQAPFSMHNMTSKERRALGWLAKMPVKSSRFDRNQNSFYSQIDSIQKKFEPRV